MELIKSIYRFLSPRFQNVFLDYRVNAVPRYGYGKPPHEGLLKIIENERSGYKGILEGMMVHMDNFQKIKKMNTGGVEPVFNNGYLPGLDMLALYSMIAHFKPNIYLEIGSGNSTKTARYSIVKNELQTKIISIDPAPRAEIESLVDQSFRVPFENITQDVIRQLHPNDILFIDNSHRILPNSDSMVFFLEILPYLPKGVIVHIHDVYLPYDYPQFMCDRFYSEQYGLAITLLANNERYRPLLPNYFISEDPELRAIIEPIWDHPNLEGVERHGCSFWLTIN